MLGPHQVQAGSRSENFPIIWLGQSVDTSSICAAHSELNKMPLLTSLGCAIRKPSLRSTHFTSDLKAKLGISGPLMLDSGGFALMMNPNSRWTIRDVSKFVGQIEADVFVSLDHPPAELLIQSAGDRPLDSVQSFFRSKVNAWLGGTSAKVHLGNC